MLSLQDDLPSSLHLLAGASVLPIGWRDCCTSSVRLLPAARDLLAALTLSISVLDRGSNADVKSTLVTDSVRTLMHSSPGGSEPASFSFAATSPTETKAFAASLYSQGVVK